MARGNTRMLSRLRVLHEELERIVDDIVGGRSRPGRARHWRPPADVFVSKGTVVIRLELAGVRREDIDLTYHEGELVVRGSRFEPETEPKEGYWQMEIPHGPFERSVNIPPRVDPDRIEAVCRDGILEVRIPKIAERDSTREVRIRTDA